MRTSVACLAARAAVSERHFTRLFVAHLGQTPARYVRAARTEAAAQLLVSSSLPLAQVAPRCGLGSVEALRQAFVDRYAVAPSHYHPRDSGPSTEHREDDETDTQRHVQQHAELRQRPGHHLIAPVVDHVPPGVAGQHDTGQHQSESRGEEQRCHG